ncbi:MAG: 5-methylthioadenosine/S-adenosylhomocysteine deaminase [Chloroflexota bacterium]|jgi:cytosine/adenosine deaminase-related metal-dependent hydrolase|nr:5-methylthioadenosine/S-adenosylhomocysteine deaminase [Chloroflexota bacterium]
MANRTLIRGAYVLTQDPDIGELQDADVLIEGDKIAAVGKGLSAEGADVIDAKGDIVIPGFIDTHRHTWETSIRTCAPDYTLGAYFGAILDKFAPNYRAEDVYAANQWGALECANAGITTLVDWSHIINTPDHADAAIRGLRDSGIRSVFAFGFPNTSLQDWWFGRDWGGSVERIDGELARRIRKDELSDDSALITMALATRGTNFCKPDVVRFEWELAKELGINITVHVAMDRFGYTKGQLRALKEMDLLYPNTTYIHASHLMEDEWLMVRDSGGNVSLAPQIELQMGHGWAPAQTAERLGIPVGLSSDVATTASSDQFTQMHAIFASERGRRHEISWEQNLDGNEPTPDLITARQVLRWATLDGAKVAGIADRTGSITPGKKADLVIIDGGAVNVAPIIDPVGAVVCAADVSNVDTVIIDGRIVKKDGKLLANLDTPRRLVEESRDYLVSTVDVQPGWMPRTPAALEAAGSIA